MIGVVALLTRSATLFRSPRRAWLSLRMMAWALVLPSLKRYVPVHRLVSFMWVNGRGGQLPTETYVLDVAQLSSRVVTLGGREGNCLERSLIAYRHLSAGGAHPLLIIGTRPGDRGLEGHVWVTVGDAPIHDSPEAISTYIPMAAFADGGRRRSLA